MGGISNVPDWLNNDRSYGVNNSYNSSISPSNVQDDDKKKLPPGAEISIWNAAAAYQG